MCLIAWERVHDVTSINSFFWGGGLRGAKEGPKGAFFALRSAVTLVPLLLPAP